MSDKRSDETLIRWARVQAENTVTANGSKASFVSDMFFELAEALESSRSEAANLREALTPNRNMNEAPIGESVLIYGQWVGEIHDEFPGGKMWGVGHRGRVGGQWHASLTDGYSVWCNEPDAWMELPEPPNGQ